MSSFAYGVRDNVPPFSFTKEIVDKNDSTSVAWSPTGNNLAGEGPYKFDFHIPESGLLDRAYLRVRMYSPWLQAAAGGAALSREPVAKAANAAAQYVKQHVNSQSSSYNFASILDSVEFTTLSNKTIQTLYPSAIAAEVQKMPSAQREFWYQCLNGFAAGPVATDTLPSSDVGLLAPFTQLYDPYMERLSTAASVTEVDHQNMFADYLIPLPFSLMDQLKDNLQTRFVDDLRIIVNFKKDAIMQRTLPAVANTTVVTGHAGFKASLVCVFHNFHDVIENSIRDQNFKRGFPASVYSHNYKREDSKTVSGKKLTVRLTHRMLTSEIICALQYQATAGLIHPTTALPPNDGMIGPFEFILYGSGRQLWRAYSWELSGPDVADYELADAHAYGEDLAKPVVGRVVNAPIAAAGTDYTINSRILSRVTMGFPHVYSLRFGFQAHDNFYTGGLALQTISNPYLEIINLGNEAQPWADGANKFDMTVVTKTCQMLRIDSDTGVITTSLDV
jgi:hypothetical protein